METVSIRTVVQRLRLIMERNNVKNKKNIIYYIIAVICITAFFAHETIISKSETIDEATLIWETAKKKRTIALSKVKEITKGTAEYENYLLEKKNTDIVYNDLLLKYEEAKFLSFDNFQQFVGEFGWALGLFIYSLSNFVLSYKEKNDTFFGKAILHITLIYVSLFYLRWTFKGEDYRTFTYIFNNFLCVIGLILSTYCIMKSLKKNSKLNHLINWIFEIRHTHYQKMAIKALDNTELYNETIEEIEEFESKNIEALYKVIDETPVGHEE